MFFKTIDSECNKLIDSEWIYFEILKIQLSTWIISQKKKKKPKNKICQDVFKQI